MLKMVNNIMDNLEELDEKVREMAIDELLSLQYQQSMIELMGGAEEVKKMWQRCY